MSDRYYGLISSLPHLTIGENGEFQLARMPISREILKSRFSSLSPKDREQIRAIIDFLQGLSNVTTLTDQQVCDMLVKAFASLKDVGVIKLFTDIIEIWVIVGALHQRQLGVDLDRLVLPPIDISDRIRRNWQHPDFALTYRFPWITTARELTEQNKLVELEKYVDRVRWQLGGKASISDPFSFEALVAYVGRWNILYRWSQVNLEAGQQRFDELVENVLKNA